MGRNEELFHKAVFLENRHRFQEAAFYYEELAKQKDITLDMLHALVQYFYKIGNYEKVLSLAKEALEKGGDLEKFVPIFVEVWRKAGSKIEELWGVYEQYGVSKQPKVCLPILQQLWAQGENVYLEAVELCEVTERLFAESIAYQGIYMDVILFLIVLEIEKENFPQARFHLRKLLFLQSDLSNKADELFVCSVKLDLLEEWWKNENLKNLSLCLCEENWDFFLIVQKMHQRKITKEEWQQFCQRTFVDPFLAEKQFLYMVYGKLAIGEEISSQEIEKVKQFHTHWLAAKIVVMVDGLKGYDFLHHHFIHYADVGESVRIFHRLEKTRGIGKKHDLDQVTITVLGGGEKIGGSSILISVKGHHILLDAGIYLEGENVIPNYALLDQLNISGHDIDALIITHAHIDHSAAAPYLHRKYPNMPIYATEETKQLMEVILADLFKQYRAEEIGFDEADLYKTLEHIKCVRHSFFIPSKDDEWKVTFYYAGHILGAVAVLLEIKGVSIFYTGDFSITDQKTVKGMVLPSNLHVDVLITENTYGSLPMNACMSRKEQEEQLIKQIKKVMDRGGNILIPAFALGRAQEIILILHEYFQSNRFFPFFVYIDGLVVEVSHIYDSYLSLEGKHVSLLTKGIWEARSFYRQGSLEEFIERVMSQGKNCIIASSGMLADGSASSRYAERIVSDKKSAIAFSGYVDEESAGHSLLNHQVNMVKLNGRLYAVEAEILSIRLSAHASREEVIKNAVSLNPSAVFLVHGDHERKYSVPRSQGEVYPTVFSLLKNNMTVPVIAAKNHTVYTFLRGEVFEWRYNG
ncbi:Metallo-beta-lactamase family protein, RNA-specific [Geobacillus proteiniphilus]|uniref:Metallo-beta-lactamase family protein, RNA-specific n=1 Tax=Geobacillus proteiniphilus TaxID=860353 RepID=A0A1Q5SYK9_9BACL|nr:MBL fold metallo-hydrolase [Geobacillus proteiniphilus]OKO93063.1 Metallo-beta-lactamase family protein, RNA-specific [Geobacillus proteiniphilus]